MRLAMGEHLAGADAGGAALGRKQLVSVDPTCTVLLAIDNRSTVYNLLRRGRAVFRCPEEVAVDPSSDPIETIGASDQGASIDAHQHFWPSGVRPRDPRTAVLERDFTPRDLAEELVGGTVAGTVLVQCAAGPEENDRLVSYAQAFPPVGAIVAWLPLDDAERAVREADRVRARTPLLRGFRAKLPESADGIPDLLRTANFAAANGLLWELVVSTDEHVRLVEEVSAECPDLRIVVDHLATPPLAGGVAGPWRKRIDRLAACPSAAMKLSVGADVLVDWEWAPSELAEYVAYALEGFGPQRTMLASNWPVIRLAIDHGAAWRALEAAVGEAGVSASEFERISSGNARSWYRIGESSR